MIFKTMGLIDYDGYKLIYAENIHMGDPTRNLAFRKISCTHTPEWSVCTSTH